MKILLTSILLCCIINTYAQDQDYWILVRNKKEQCAYKDRKGKIRIPYGRYEQCFTDTLIEVAFVFHKDSGLIAINRKQEILFEGYNYDNGPDQVSEGLFRIKQNSKTGFANEQGKVVIEAIYLDAFPFSEGLSAVFTGTSKEGKAMWIFINTKGEKAIDGIFESANSFSSGIATVSMNGIEYRIDKKGQKTE